jgi:hypothetical protein
MDPGPPKLEAAEIVPAIVHGEPPSPEAKLEEVTR